MKSTLNQRLKEYLEYNRISPPDFYKTLGITRMDYSGWVNEGRSISISKVQAILELYQDMNARWFLLGEGTMSERYEDESSGSGDMKYIDCPQCDARQEQIDILKDQIDNLKDHITSLKDNAGILRTKVADKETIIEQKSKELDNLKAQIKSS